MGLGCRLVSGGRGGVGVSLGEWWSGWGWGVAW